MEARRSSSEWKLRYANKGEKKKKFGERVLDRITVTSVLGKSPTKRTHLGLKSGRHALLLRNSIVGLS